MYLVWKHLNSVAHSIYHNQSSAKVAIGTTAVMVAVVINASHPPLSLGIRTRESTVLGTLINPDKLPLMHMTNFFMLQSANYC